eukprot:s4336_g5.t2
MMAVQHHAGMQARLHAEVAAAAEKTGIAKSLKSEMRFRLIQSLHKASHLQAFDPDDRVPLAERALYSLVLEFLRHRQKDYSLSVLLPECGMTSSDVLAADEVGQALSLQKSPAYRLASKMGDEPLLDRLLRVVAASEEPICNATGVQTDPQGIGETIDAKLRACAVSGEHKDRRTIEERMLQFRARCEAMVRKESEAELARVRMLEREQIALEEAAKSRAEVQEALAKAKRELSEREERLHQRERLALERTRAKELDLEKKAVEWRAAAQQVIDEEQVRQSTRAKHLDVEDKRLKILKEGLDRREQELRLAEERNSAAATELTQRTEETREAAKMAAQAAVAAEREELRQSQLSLDREKIQVAGIRDHHEALKDRLFAETAEAERSANQARKDARAAEEGLSAKARELAEAREQIQLLKVAGQQVVAFQQELEVVRSEKAALRHMLDTEKQAHARAEAELGQLQKDRSRLGAEVEELRSLHGKLEEKLVAAENVPSALVRQLQETRSRLSTEASETERLRQQLQVAEQRAAPHRTWVSALQNLEQEIFSGCSPDMEVGKVTGRSRALEERTRQLEREISAFEQRHRRREVQWSDDESEMFAEEPLQWGGVPWCAAASCVTPTPGNPCASRASTEHELLQVAGAVPSPRLPEESQRTLMPCGRLASGPRPVPAEGADWTPMTPPQALQQRCAPSDMEAPPRAADVGGNSFRAGAAVAAPSREDQPPPTPPSAAQMPPAPVEHAVPSASATQAPPKAAGATLAAPSREDCTADQPPAAPPSAAQMPPAPVEHAVPSASATQAPPKAAGATLAAPSREDCNSLQEGRHFARRLHRHKEEPPPAPRSTVSTTQTNSTELGIAWSTEANQDGRAHQSSSTNPSKDAVSTRHSTSAVESSVPADSAMQAQPKAAGAAVAAPIREDQPPAAPPSAASAAHKSKPGKVRFLRAAEAPEDAPRPLVAVPEACGVATCDGKTSDPLWDPTSRLWRARRGFSTFFYLSGTVVSADATPSSATADKVTTNGGRREGESAGCDEKSSATLPLQDVVVALADAIAWYGIGCSDLWEASSPVPAAIKAIKSSKAKPAMKAMKAMKSSKAKLAMKAMKAMKVGQAKTAMKAMKAAKGGQAKPAMKAMKAAKVGKAKTAMKATTAMKVGKAKTAMKAMKGNMKGMKAMKVGKPKTARPAAVMADKLPDHFELMYEVNQVIDGDVVCQVSVPREESLLEMAGPVAGASVHRDEAGPFAGVPLRLGQLLVRRYIGTRRALLLECH